MGGASAFHAPGRPWCVVRVFAMRSMCRARDRINSYPAAPFRPATMLNAWIITERRDGAHLSSGTLAKRTWSHRSDPPTLPGENATLEAARWAALVLKAVANLGVFDLVAHSIGGLELEHPGTTGSVVRIPNLGDLCQLGDRTFSTEASKPLKMGLPVPLECLVLLSHHQ